MLGDLSGVLPMLREAVLLTEDSSLWKEVVRTMGEVPHVAFRSETAGGERVPDGTLEEVGSRAHRPNARTRRTENSPNRVPS